jgi:hypothetical protein
MNPIEILKREWHDQLIVTLDVLNGNHPGSINRVAITAASISLCNWLRAIPDAPPPLAPRQKTE